jgi:hypothetical protein
MTKSTVHSDKDSLQKKEAAVEAAFPELFKAGSPILVNLKNPKPLSLDTAGSELYAAVMNGEVQTVRGQLRHGDKMSEGEAVMMIRAINKAREKGNSRRRKDADGHAQRVRTKKKYAEAALFKPARLTSGASKTASKSLTTSTASKAGYFFNDSFGGRYDGAGYEMADGSYRMTGGEFYNATDNVLTLKDGKTFKLASDLRDDAASIMRTALQVRSLRIGNAAPQKMMADKKFAGIAPQPAAEVKGLAATVEIMPEAPEVAADALAIETTETATRAAAIMGTERFEAKAEKAPAAALGDLDGKPGLSEEDLHLAIHLHRFRRERKRMSQCSREDNDTLDAEECRELLERIAEGMTCVDRGSLRRCHVGESYGITVSFNPAAREGQIDFTPVMNGLRGCFKGASAKNKPEVAATAHAKMVMV